MRVRPGTGHEIIDPHAVFQILEQCPNRHPRPPEKPFAADFSGLPLHRLAVTPIEHHNPMSCGLLGGGLARNPGADRRLPEVGLLEQNLEQGADLG